MGEGLLRHLASDKVDVFSAGSEPSGVNSFALRAMRQRGIDISSHSSDHINRYLDREFDYVITVCDSAADNCPLFPGRAMRIHWRFPDPAAAKGDDDVVLQSFISVRDGLEFKLREWLNSENRLK